LKKSYSGILQQG